MIRRILPGHAEISGVRWASKKSSSKGGMFGFAALTKKESDRLAREWEKKANYYNARLRKALAAEQGQKPVDTESTSTQALATEQSQKPVNPGSKPTP